MPWLKHISIFLKNNTDVRSSQGEKSRPDIQPLVCSSCIARKNISFALVILRYAREVDSCFEDRASRRMAGGLTSLHRRNFRLILP